MVNLFEKSLNKIDKAPQKNFGKLGSWTIQNSPELFARTLEQYAKKTGTIKTYNAYLKLHSQKLKKPKEPKLTDQKYKPKTKETIEQRIKRLLVYKNDLNQFQNEEKNHKKQTANTNKIKSTFNPDLKGYLGYAHFEISCMAKEPKNTKILADFEAFSKKKRSLPISEHTAKLGTFIVGSHGSGKSEVLKHRVWHYLTKEKIHETIIVIDPHGELAPELARMKPNLNNDRLVYFDPYLKAHHTPCMSILNTNDKTPDNLKKEAEAYGAALEMISGGEMSDNMTSLCERAAHIILENDKFNIVDLMKLINTSPPKRGKPEKPYPPVYNFAVKKSSNFIIRDFFQDNFLYGNFTQAKNGLYERFTRVLTSPVVQRMFLNPQTINFAQLVNQRKVIIINLPSAQLGDDVTKMIGQMIVAQIQLAVRNRDLKKIEKYPQVHLFIDESHNFVSSDTAKQIDELRKFRLSLTLATQYIEKFPATILESVKGLGVQIAGYCAGKNLTEMNAVFDLKTKYRQADLETNEATILSNLPVGNFYIKSRAAAKSKPMKARQFSIDTSLLFNSAEWKEKNKKQYMTDQEWEECKQDQLAKYYLKVENTDYRETQDGDKNLSFETKEQIDEKFDRLKPVLGFQ